ncbi:MAG: four helix bundle protein [Patescibacteria group bacterium]
MEELSVITVTYEIYKKLIVLTTTIDKKYRYTLGEPAVTSCATILEQLTLAKHAPKPLKATYLINADAAAELTALKLRAILELKLANETNVLKLQARLSEARRQIGGWRKSVT